MIVMTQSIVAEGRAIVPELFMSWKVSLFIVTATNTFDLIFLVAYPIPFIDLVPDAAYQKIKYPVQRVRLYAGILSVLAVVMIVYPVYSAVYSLLEGYAQLSFTLVLFIVKLVMKNALVSASSIKTGSSSSAVTILIMTLDITQSFLSLRGIRIQELKTNELLTSAGKDPSRDLIGRCLELCRAASAAAVAIVPESSNTTRADGLETFAIRPKETPSFEHEDPPDKLVSHRRDAQDFFNCEYPVLLEYLESAILLVYVTYTYALFHLPNVVYFLDSDDMTEAKLTNTATRILGLASLEVLTLVGFCVLVSRAFSFLVLYQLAFSFLVLYQLAFVLENQLERIQTKLFSWTTFSLFFTLQHNDVDFSLKFAWTKKHNART